MKPRTRRASGGVPRNHRVPIAFSDQEYTLLAEAAHRSGISPSTFIALSSLKEADKIVAKQKPK
jgi:uncharacterized protein (DUF1778 family)